MRSARHLHVDDQTHATEKDSPMTHHDEGPIDKVKDAVGMNDDEESTASLPDTPDAEDRSGGWAGVDQALGGADDKPIYETGETSTTDPNPRH